MLDPNLVRSHFPALQSDWTFFDNAGGSAPCIQVIDRVRDYLSTHPWQLGASYAVSEQASQMVHAGRSAMAEWIGAEPSEVVLGPSSTVLARQLAESLRPTFDPGDQIVVTNLDHESNIGPWRALASVGVEIREWKFRHDTHALELEDLNSLLSERTRLVCFPHVSNIVGNVHDVRAICDRVHAVGALACVDGVAFAPHRRVQVRDLGADFYFFSAYKTYGPHVGVLYGKKDQLLAAKGLNHFFVSESSVPLKFEPGNVNYELTASLPGILEYLRELGRSHAKDFSSPASLDQIHEAIATHEDDLSRPLLRFLSAHPRVTLFGRDEPGPGRVPTISFTVEGVASSALPLRLDQQRIAIRYGHFYAYRCIDSLGLLERDGVVRISMVHYNTSEEVARLIEALDEILQDPSREA